MKALVLIQAASTWALVGLIWTVQVVQYPLFAKVGDSAFMEYHAGHSARISLVVIPLMFAELISAGLLVAHVTSFAQPEGPVTPATAWLGAALVAVVWLSTFFLQVPKHGALSGGFDAAAHSFLVSSNWLRTIAWTARGALVMWWLSRLN